MVDHSSAERRSDGSEPLTGSQPVELRWLISAHYQDVYRYAFRLCGQEADALDLTQQTFLLAHKRLHQLREPDRADRWLFAILRTTFLKSVRRPMPALVDTLELSVEDTSSDPRELQSFDREALQKALDGLSDDYRLVVLMFYFDELPYKEIAEQLEIPMGTVMSRLARAKAQLRASLSEDPKPAKKPPGPLRPRVQIV